MGTFLHPITIIGPSGQETLDALVDTGSTFTTIPRPILERLGVSPFTRARLRRATGDVETTDLGEVSAELDGQDPRTVICAFGRPDSPPAIGAHALEAFLLGVDPDQKRLVPLDGWWASS
jgi:predicted aspartyl protease